MFGLLKHISKVARFRRSESGATAVEFCVLLPVMLVTFGAIVEGSRIYWNYQGAVAGVRDSARYMARITNNDICVTNPLGLGNTAPITGGALIARGIVDLNMDVGQSGTTHIFPSGVSVTGVTANYQCVPVASGVGTVPVAIVGAGVRIELPFSGLFAFFGNQAGAITTTITDQSRIYGL